MSQNTESIAVLEITCGETTGYMVQEVNQLLKQFQQMRVMVKKIGKMGGIKMPFHIK